MTIFPSTETGGGVVYRDETGQPTNPPNVSNAYSPAPGFVITCPATALPADCEARIEPKQVNALVSEMLSLAECWDPNGPWNCTTLDNMCHAFQVWASQFDPSLFILRTGDTMSGPLIMWRDPVEELEAATKRYADQYALPPVLDAGMF